MTELFKDYRCPKCGFSILTSGANIWCSHVGCDFRATRLDAQDRKWIPVGGELICACSDPACRNLLTIDENGSLLKLSHGHMVFSFRLPDGVRLMIESFANE